MSTNTNNNEAAEPKKSPVEKIRIGQCTVDIWENKDKKNNIRASASFDRRYRDKSGAWKSSDSYDLVQLLAHREAVNQAIDKLMAYKNGGEY